MTREIKFRAWEDVGTKGTFRMTYDVGVMPNNINEWQENSLLYINPFKGSSILMQFTGLKDKNGLQEVYEGDIIDEYGNIKGNTYEMDAGETDFIIQGFGDKNWGATYKEAVGRGCTDTQRYADTDEVRKLD